MWLCVNRVGTGENCGSIGHLSKEKQNGFSAPPRVKEGVPPLPSLSKDKKPMPHSSLWKNGVTAEMGLYSTRYNLLLIGSKSRTN